jgi:hypothetical protein
MALPVTISLANPAPNVCPATFAEAINLIRALLSGSVTGTYLPYVVGSDTPASDDQDKIWHRVDGNGRPLGTFRFYNGTWRRFYDAFIGQVVMYSGVPTGVLDDTGLGVVGGNLDGWALCNGNNGTPNLTDKFIVAAHLDLSDGGVMYSSGWKTEVTGASLGTGGAKDITLTDDTTYRPARPEIKVGGWNADGNDRGDDQGLYGNASNPDTAIHILQDADEGNTEPDAILTVPPFYALAFVQFVGY